MNSIDGWMTRVELNFLATEAAKMDSIIELGSWKGRSTVELLENCPGTVIAVDWFAGSKGEEIEGVDTWPDFTKNVAGFDLGVMKMPTDKAAKFLRPVDMVFIDAGHDYESVSADIKNYLPLAKKLICGHDYMGCWPGVIQAVNEAFGEENINVKGSIWYVRIKDLNDSNPTR